MQVVVGLAGVLVGAIAGAFAPAIIRAVPEPEDAEPDKVPYATLAAMRQLRAGSTVVGAVVLGAFGLALGPSWSLVLVAPWVPLGIALAFIDWHTHRLPTWLLGPAYPVTVVLLLLCAVLTHADGGWVDLRRAGIGWLVVGGFYLALHLVGPTLMGYGDVRLAGLLGPVLGFLGWGPLVVGMVAPMLAQSFLGLALVLRHRSLRQLKRRLPFGPTMLGGAALGVAAGSAAADWYLRQAGLS